ncbi:ABC1 kinase family protein [Qipengyuania flava]|uniref:ABC1 kinase family protein n=1 Tax=Qipengyuania flava TaxID=192812 RepID=UPI001C58E539|nr:AarF/ABC1/UbiB kinase family protein [Qipengyuania flava]MBW3167580.1 AarF/ABC1/UbiB kinase family protein [Qipengyuania flava]MBY5964818.1 AarF/ABC1/UbiB kinase family protein [Qipengyuania flava]MBY6011142.1 AarF/ABC1/UbiB kinase family protein [Qipengyuania flava]MBY6025584.1 AarF/ABC1/UbiB kinase family protein [Qipengyuania flava]
MDDDDTPKKRHRAIPSSRAARLGAFGRLAGGVASGMLGEGARRLARGERPRMRDLVLTPGNVGRLADRLSHLRGAAMKLGQMISMDAGDLLPPELAAILAQLRSQAHRMPPEQLRRVLDSEWGPDWRRRFARFNATPIAAASIGQVHRATLPDGRELAIKVQYPGVRESIDSDVDNVATLLRVSGVLPRELDFAPLLTEAKRQLHEEADYEREAAQMTRFADWLDGHADYVVPRPLPELTTARVLAMDFIDGIPIEALADAPQEQRDAAMRDLMALVLREMFEFGAMQTDPNFANYRFQPDAGRLVLLDFGAARDVDPATAQGYRSLLSAGLSGDRDAVREAARAAGFLGEAAVARHRPLVDRMIDIVVTEMNRPGPFDFGDRGFVEVLREHGMEMAADRSTWHIPPVETLFVQRKVSGTALLAARLEARVDVRELVRPYLQEGAG